ncbi:MAG: type 1 glutamine amidotransferase [Candidatus Omnitrophica bacterium]|nr:type 1 glutamine amidotransferase [Candidatus Omnitrophota bacterium]
MRIHYLQHVPFEGLARIGNWARRNRFQVTRTPFFEGAALPSHETYDFLIIVGGPMGVCDEAQYPWLINEKRFIEAAIGRGKIVLGICLGAQLIASVLGSKVTRNPYREIGWFPVTLTPEARQTPYFSSFLGDELTAFHWHGDTFEIPKGAIRLASSGVCLNQAFLFSDTVMGLQFHLESSPESVKALVQNCDADIDGSPYVQSKEMILTKSYFPELERAMLKILGVFRALSTPSPVKS